ncbi:MAG: hypothetical protein U0L85_10150 [Bacilli bacterium]|nr:hypothetical protein [Bacilli bacterium]
MMHIDQRTEELKNDIERFVEDFKEDIENISVSRHLDKLLLKMKELDENQYNQIIKNKNYVERPGITAFPHLLNKKRIIKNEKIYRN